MTAPFCDATRAELVARVAYQLVVLEHRKSPGAFERPGLLIATVQASWFVRQSLDFRLALSSMYQACGVNGTKSRKWHADVITRARCGILFRAVFAPTYKAGRRDPRVTNRGVIPRSHRRPEDAAPEEPTVRSDRNE